MPHEKSTQRALKTRLYFHAMILVRAADKKLNIFENAVNSTLAGTTAELMQKVWDALTYTCLLEPLTVFMKLYVGFNLEVNQLQVLSQ